VAHADVPRAHRVAASGGTEGRRPLGRELTALDVRAVVARTLPRLTLLGNLFGAVLLFFYLRFIDPVFAAGPRPGVFEIAYFIVAFGLLVAVTQAYSRRWRRPITGGTGADPALVRRRALLVPYMFAGITAAAWMLAGVLWGVVWPLTIGRFSPSVMLRVVFGTTCAGTAATAFIFFATEHRWRSVLPAFFPEGDLGAVPGIMRLPVRARLLVMFLMVSVVPLSILGVFTYTRAVAMLGADPAHAVEMVGATVPVIVFILAVGGAAAVGLSVFVSQSVAIPLGYLEAAMAEVGHGNLDTRCAVVANDEIGAVAEGFNRMVQGLRDREFVKEAFGKYVTREIRDEILAGRIALGGQALEVTILFADLRDFTPWVEATPPDEVVRELNAYFTEMEAAIREHRGLVLQFIGDEIEAVFGAPVPYPGHAEMAVRAALDMRRRLAAWNAAREAAGKRPLRHGIGIHTGTVLAGNIGSAERVSYALVGDAVNLASRIQQLTKELGSDILVSGATRRLLDEGFEIVPLPAVRVKGKSDEIEVCRLA
jgi:adenylate cyclase